MVKNKLFYQKLKKLVDKTITFFDEIEINKIKKKLIIKIDPNDERSYQTIEVPSYELLIMDNSFFYQLDEYRDCITTIQEDQILNEHFTKLIIIDNGSRRLFSSRTLDLICAEILEQHKNNSANNFERIYKDLEELLYNDKIPIIITLPVSNISINDEKFLVDNFKVRRLSAKEKEQFLNSYFISSLIPREFYLFNTVIEYRYNITKRFHLENENITSDNKKEETIDCLLSTLFILQDGYLKILGRFKKIDLDLPENDKFAFPVGYSQDHFDNFNIDNIENNQIIKYYNLISKLVKHTMIANALSWFNSFAGEKNIQKKIIFLAIVIEILFTKIGEKDSLTHKLSSRIAHLIKNDYESRKKTYCNIKGFYDFRSSILHGENFEKIQNEKDGKKYLKNGGLEYSYSYIRDAFKRYLEESDSFNPNNNFITEHNEFIKKLDLQ